MVPGGETGQESIRKGLAAIEADCSPEDLVMVHDGNRCNVSQQVISDSLAICHEWGGAVAAIPCVEVVFRSTDGLEASEEIPREWLWRTQTPHTYPLKKMLWAHSEAERLGLTNTAATCSLMAKLGEQIHFSRGSEENLKITTVDDLRIFEALQHADSSTSWLK